MRWTIALKFDDGAGNVRTPDVLELECWIPRFALVGPGTEPGVELRKPLIYLSKPV